MIKRVYRSKADIENLSRLRTEIPAGIDTFDYRRIVVNKPWGYEYLLFGNEYTSIWVLYLKHGYGTSMHCHSNKKTALVVLSGKVVCSTLEGWIERKEGEGILIDEAVFHSTKAKSTGDAFIMETESPPNKKDLVRLKDKYGREKKGYEGESFMSRELDRYEYVDFHEVELSQKISKSIHTCRLSMGSYRSSTSREINHLLKEETGQLICLLEGKIHDLRGKVVLSAGEVGVLPEIQSRLDIVAFKDISYLILDYNGKKSKTV